MRWVVATLQLRSVCQRRMYRTPLGGSYFEEELPSTLGATRAKGGISTVNTSSNHQKKKKKKLPLSVPLTAEGLKAQLRQLVKETEVYAQRRSDEGNINISNSTYLEESRHAMQRRARESEMEAPTTRVVAERSPIVMTTELTLKEEEEEKEMSDIVLPGFSVLGSDLDRIERDMMREYHQRGKELPKFDSIYAKFGGGRRGKTSYHIAAEEYRQRMARGEYSKEVTTRKLITKSTGVGQGINLCRNFFDKMPLKEGKENLDSENEVILPPESNPHFPVEVDDSIVTEAEVTTSTASLNLTQSDPTNTTTDSTSTSNSISTSIKYDAYKQRPADNRLLNLRGIDFWNEKENRHKLQQHIDYSTEGYLHEMLTEGAMDTSEVGYSVNKVRKETLLYFQAHPINEMIQEPFVRIRSILPNDGEAEVHFPAGDFDTDIDIPVSQARRMARELGLDLIRVGAIHTDKSDRRVVALCTIADHREHMRDMIRFKMQKLGVQPPPTRECIEVPFRGGTHPHAIRFKSIGIAKHILHGHAVRINLTKFGTPREGFPVFSSILDELKQQALQLRAYHTAGTVRANYNEIYCYLYPSTGKSPKTTVTHPTQEQLDAVRDQRILENEREIYFDDLNDAKTARERLAYLKKLQDGTAWAAKDDGLSLQRQRDLKVMLGYLPKGNRELYEARGDVNVSAPFRASHPTSVERWTHPPETNLEQASRGAAVLGKRLTMSVSEMHDRQETSEQPTTLDRFYYKIQGPALEAGEFKEALGLKGNRKKLPRSAPGWATLGMSKQPQEEPGFATK